MKDSLIIWRETRVEKGKDQRGRGNMLAKMLMSSIKVFGHV